MVKIQGNPAFSAICDDTSSMLRFDDGPLCRGCFKGDGWRLSRTNHQWYVGMNQRQAAWSRTVGQRETDE